MKETTQLPEPDKAAQAHSRALLELMQGRSNANSLSFYDFMQTALFEPGYGYYMAGAQKFGPQGDFITAPELTPLFGQCIAQQMLEVLQESGGDVLEFGAGAGGMAASIVPLLVEHSTARYLILEPSAELQRRQQQRLQNELTSEQFASVSWVTQLPQSFCGVYLANEVLDAFAVERFRINDLLQVEQLRVSVHVDGLDEQWAVAPVKLEAKVRHLEKDLGRSFPKGYQSEINLALQPWCESVAQSLKRGAMLIIDYGYPRAEYYSAERSSGTLTCYFQHRAHGDPYHYPGLQDLTAHVDFTAVVEAASEVGLNLLGYTNQASFLIALNLLQLAEDRAAAMESEAERIRGLNAVKTLTLPGQMGERFQVMALGKGIEQTLRGFTSLDLSYRL